MADRAPLDSAPLASKRPDPARRARLVREGLLALGFVLLVVASVLTVAVPELTKEPEPEPGTGQGPARTTDSPGATGSPDPTAKGP